LNILMKFWSALGRIFQDKRTAHLLLFLFVFTTLAFIFALNYVPTTTIRVGEVSPRDYAADRTVEFENIEATREARVKAANQVKMVYVADSALSLQAENNITATFDIMRRIQALQTLEDNTQVQELLGRIPLKLKPQTIDFLRSLNPPTLSQVEETAKNLLGRVMRKGVRESALEQARKAISDQAQSLSLPQQFADVVAEVATTALVPNVMADERETMRKQQDAMAAVEPVKTYIRKGQIILRKGEIVTPQHLEYLLVLQKYQPRYYISGIISVAIFVLMVILLVLVYLQQRQPRVMGSVKYLFLLSVIVVVTLAACRWSVNTSGYLAPVAVASILLATLVDFRLAMLLTSLLSLSVGMFTGQLSFAVVALLTGMAAVLSVSRIRKRSQLIYSGFIIAIVNVLAALVFELMLVEPSWQVMARNLVYAFINGMACALIAIGSLPFFENFFDITTQVKLLELSNPGEPLLRRLMMEAPGTWNHSMHVANLAEAAAQEVDADPLLARVGAYYHDIGKVRRPYFFVENQLGRENPHDKLAPSLSTLIITSHIKDGLELAREYHLPHAIQNFITEHHGHALVAYFYHQARLRDTEANEEDYRYHGQRPRSKETAIVMLADALEAATRSLAKPTPTKIENLVKQLIKDILADGQLDECTLTFRDLDILARTFTRTLTGMYHARIEYPERFTAEIDGQGTRPRKLFSLPRK